MSYVRLEDVSKSFAGESVLRGVSFRVEEGDKIGLIGRNGTGKSTIFRLILGEFEPDSGTIERMKRARVACLAQMPVLNPADTLFGVVMHSFAELLEMEHRLRDMESRLTGHDNAILNKYSELQETFQLRGGYEFRTNAKRVLHGLGFSVADFDLHVSALSGGQRTRLMLALVLLQDADLLLLDEPENHLDLEAREWLESFLKDWPRAFVIISHDRQMLNAVTNRIVEVERGELRGFTGNYDAYMANKTLLQEQQQKAFDRQQDFVEKEERWINRFRYKASKASQVQSRIKRLDKLDRVDAPESESSAARFSLGEVVRSGAVVLEAKGLSKAYGELRLYENVSFQVERGERVGIIGPNGTGKTTLLRHLAGELDACSGSVTAGHKVRIGFYDQHHEGMNPAGDVFSEIGQTRPDMTPVQIRTFMGRFLFTGEDVFKPISALSGGERSRVAIAKLILEGANVLLLDEPTNHLDIASREALESALEEFPGSLVLVSHDRALIDRMVTKLVILEHGHTETHLGNYSHYRWKRADSAPQAGGKSTDAVLKIRRTKKTARDKASQQARRKRRNRLEDLERDIAEVEELIDTIEGRFAALDPADFAATQELKAEYDGLKQDLSDMYEEWERLAEETFEV